MCRNRDQVSKGIKGERDINSRHTRICKGKGKGKRYAKLPLPRRIKLVKAF